MLSLKRGFSAIVFGFYGLILLLPDAYDVFGAALVVLSIVVIAVCRPRIFQGLDGWFAFFLALYPLSLLPSLAAKGGEFHYFDYTIRCLLFIPLVWALRMRADRASFEKAFYLGANTGGVAACLFALKSLILDHVDRVGLPITNPIAYGQIAALLAIISMASFFRFSQIWRKYSAVFGFLGAIFAVIASGSGGALLGLGCGLLFEVAVFCRWNRSKVMAYIISGLCVVAFAVLAPLAVHKFSQIVFDVQAFSDGHGMGTSQGQRLILWRIALQEIFRSPWFGIGPGHFDPVIHGYCLLHVCNEGFRGFHGVHNQYLDSFMNGGIFALLGLFTSLLAPLVLFLKRSIKMTGADSVSAVAGVSVIAAAIVMAFSQVFYGHNIWVITYFFTVSFLWFLSAPAVRNSTGTVAMG